MRALICLSLVGCAAAPSSLRGEILANGVRLEHVFVHLEEGVGPGPWEFPTDQVQLRQRGIEFIPRVFGIRTGQPLRITSEDSSPHNVHCSPIENEGFNVNLMEGEAFVATFTKPEAMIEFKCHLHAAMRAYAGVVSHPFFAVTDGNGRFEIRNVPAGRYVLRAWEEGLGATRTAVQVPGPDVILRWP